jgi:protein transport protein SEC13
MTLDSIKISIDSHHDDIIHDAKLNHDSSMLATCSSDHAIRIFYVGSEKEPQVIRGHDGPVWQVAWAPVLSNSFPLLLASCSSDGHVKIWQERNASWILVYDHLSHHDSSVNTISWVPDDLNILVLACGSSDGNVSILHIDVDKSNEFIVSCMAVFPAHPGGCTTLAWRPALHTTSTLSDVLLASGGCDKKIRIWNCIEKASPRKMDLNHDKSFVPNRYSWVQCGSALQGHTDWVRDISWAPILKGLPINMFASCGQDRRVLIWSTMYIDDADTSSIIKGKSAPSINSNPIYRCTAQISGVSGNESISFDEVVWKVNWSPIGSVLAISYGDNKVSLWKETISGAWECVSSIQEVIQSTSETTKVI